MTGVAIIARCGTIRASMFYRAPVFSEAEACVREAGHRGYHRDTRGGMWDVRPLGFDSNTEKGAAK
ncbi:hypothetical protein ACH4TV_38770 [Streptomyces sp. NPDC020898]|uniref:hypothetical protein n=1 Tax=Streptomyces sp. NPDC020898 TaxID=3365101 RepID=UPI0037BD75B1